MKLRTKKRVYFLLAVLSSTSAFASPSSFLERASYNSNSQFITTSAASWGFDERAYGQAAITYSNTPVKIGSDRANDKYFIGLVSVGYAHENIALDLGLNASNASLSRIQAVGGAFGLTYLYSPDKETDYGEAALATSLHPQVYMQHEEQPPILWTRLGFLANSLKSSAITEGDNKGSQTAFTFDVYYPSNPELLLVGGMGFYSYDDTTGLFKNAFRDTNDAHANYANGTIQGLPRITAYFQANWAVSARDAFLPRYQLSQLQSESMRAHTFDLGWRHQFAKKIFVTPSYEHTVLGASNTSGIIFEFLYLF
jgi:hypothetical protein